MKTVHPRYHWITVAAVAAVALVAFEAWGQSPSASAVFAGRPAMAGAQAGLGAQAGVAQGGIGLQGSDGAQLNLRRPRIVDTQPQNMPQGRMDVIAANNVDVTLAPPQHDRDSAAELAGSGKRAERAAQRNAERAVTGASPIDPRDARAAAR